jgi:hypothetical protein
MPWPTRKRMSLTVALSGCCPAAVLAFRGSQSSLGALANHLALPDQWTPIGRQSVAIVTVLVSFVVSLCLCWGWLLPFYLSGIFRLWRQPLAFWIFCADLWHACDESRNRLRISSVTNPVWPAATAGPATPRVA